MPTFEMSRLVPAPRERVWEVVGDVAALASHAPNLSASEVLDGVGEGMVRRCYNRGGEGWSETCTLWEPGHRYAMEVDTSDYPYPLKTMRGTWAVEDHDGGTLIHLRYDYELNYGVLGRLLGALMRPAFARVCTKMLDSYEEALGLRGAVRGPRSLRRALRVNAAFSGASGAVALAASGTLAAEFGVRPLVVALVGAALVAFASGLWVLAARPLPGRREVWLVVGLDLVWVVGTVAVLGAFSSSISAAGALMLVGAGLVVALIASLQAVALRATA